jgi:hypothetical protein
MWPSSMAVLNHHAANATSEGVCSVATMHDIPTTHTPIDGGRITSMQFNAASHKLHTALETNTQPAPSGHHRRLHQHSMPCMLLLQHMQVTCATCWALLTEEEREWLEIADVSLPQMDMSAITAGQSWLLYRATYYGGIDVPQAKVLAFDCKASQAGNTLLYYPQLHYLVMCDRGCSHTIHSPNVPRNACTPTPNACMCSAHLQAHSTCTTCAQSCHRPLAISIP